MGFVCVSVDITVAAAGQGVGAGGGARVAIGITDAVGGDVLVGVSVPSELHAATTIPTTRQINITAQNLKNIISP